MEIIYPHSNLWYYKIIFFNFCFLSRVNSIILILYVRNLRQECLGGLTKETTGAWWMQTKPLDSYHNSRTPCLSPCNQIRKK